MRASDITTSKFIELVDDSDSDVPDACEDHEDQEQEQEQEQLDAEEEEFFPSVSEVLSMFDKPQLDLSSQTLAQLLPMLPTQAEQAAIASEIANGAKLFRDIEQKYCLPFCKVNAPQERLKWLLFVSDLKAVSAKLTTEYEVFGRACRQLRESGKLRRFYAMVRLQLINSQYLL